MSAEYRNGFDDGYSWAEQELRDLLKEAPLCAEATLLAWLAEPAPPLSPDAEPLVRRLNGRPT